MTFWKLVGFIFGIVFIIGAVGGFSLWVIEVDRSRAEKLAQEKQRIELMEVENRLLKAKCGSWRMEQAE